MDNTLELVYSEQQTPSVVAVILPIILAIIISTITNVIIAIINGQHYQLAWITMILGITRNYLDSYHNS